MNYDTIRVGDRIRPIHNRYHTTEPHRRLFSIYKDYRVMWKGVDFSSAKSIGVIDEEEVNHLLTSDTLEKDFILINN